MRFRWEKKYLYWGITVISVIVTGLCLFYCLFHMASLRSLFRKVYIILSPLVYGAIIAYVLNPVVRFFEDKLIYPLLKRCRGGTFETAKKIIRIVCVLLTLLMFYFAIYGLLILLIPQIFANIIKIIENFPGYLNSIKPLFNDIPQRAENWLNLEMIAQVKTILRNFSAGVFDAVNFLKNFLIGSIISIYMMYGKENFIARGKQFLYAVLEPERVNATIRDLQYVNNIFSKFIIGNIIDSLIVGIMCYIGLSVLGMPYTLLISVIVGVTNIIPFFGPYIGAIPSALLILLINPLQSLYFVIFILLLQQLDGNFLAPKILGDTTGLSGFMVIAAIIVGGGFFGIFGMFVGVPVCAVICTIIRNQVFERLKEVNFPTDLNYYKDV